MISPFGLFPPNFFFSFFCCVSILPCCNCFNYSFIYPNIFFIFLILFCFLFFYIVLLLFFFLSSFFFLLCHKAWGILVPRLEVRPELQWWELRVQTAGLTDNLRAQGISIGVRPPRSPHLSTKTQLYPSACKLQCWTTQDKQPVRHEYKTTHTHTHTHTHTRNDKKICHRQRSKVKTYKTK